MLWLETNLDEYHDIEIYSCFSRINNLVIEVKIGMCLLSF